jgi:hypothetical protein
VIGIQAVVAQFCNVDNCPVRIGEHHEIHNGVSDNSTVATTDPVSAAV